MTYFPLTESTLRSNIQAAIRAATKHTYPEGSIEIDPNKLRDELMHRIPHE